MPCPHFDVKVIQRSKRQSAVAAAAYQSGERLFSEYDQKQKYYSHKSEIVHTEIMLPPHAPPEYADRNTLWNAAETQEKQWNSQLARRLVLAIPRDIPPEQQADLIRDYCREFFVSKGMIADFAIHDKGDGNPHAHILFTMRGMDETGKWLPKSRKVYGFNSRVEWCACFVSWCYGQMGLSEPRFAACQSQGIPWFQSHGQWGGRDYANIAPGDAIFFDWDLDGSADHVGLVVGTDGSRVYTVEGNSGDACKIKSYSLSYECIKGYGLMNW